MTCSWSYNNTLTGTLSCKTKAFVDYMQYRLQVDPDKSIAMGSVILSELLLTVIQLF